PGAGGVAPGVGVMRYPLKWSSVYGGVGDGVGEVGVGVGVGVGVRVPDGAGVGVCVPHGTTHTVTLVIVSTRQPVEETLESEAMRKRNLNVCPMTFGPRFATVLR